MSFSLYLRISFPMRDCRWVAFIKTRCGKPLGDSDSGSLKNQTARRSVSSREETTDLSLKSDWGRGKDPA